jgi:hypothetical protein
MIESCTAGLGLPRGAVEETFGRLADSQAIVLKPGTTEIWMAHPFSGEPTSVTAANDDHVWNANCGWDGLAILALAGDRVVRAPNPLGGPNLEWTVANGEVEPGGVVHFLVPASQFWDDIGYT